jgi:hypothetical protein
MVLHAANGIHHMDTNSMAMFLFAQEQMLGATVFGKVKG